MDSKSDDNVRNVLVLKKEKRSVRELLNWLNKTLDINITKLPELRTGAEYCQLMHKLYPSVLPLSKVHLLTNTSFEIECNYKLLRTAFEKLQLSRDVPNRELIRGLGHYDFLNWFYKFGNSNKNQRPYNALKERKGKPIGFKKIPEPDRRYDYAASLRRSNTLLASVSPRKPLEAGQRTKSFSILEKPLKQSPASNVVPRECKVAFDGPIAASLPAPPPLARCYMPGKSVPPPPPSYYYMPPLESKVTPCDPIADPALLHPPMPPYYMAGQPVPAPSPYYYPHMQTAGEPPGAPPFPYYYTPYPFITPGQLPAWSAPPFAYEPAKSFVPPPYIYEPFDSPMESGPHIYEPLQSIDVDLLSLVDEPTESDEPLETFEPAERFEPAEMGEPVEPVKPAKSARPSEFTKPSEQGKPAKRSEYFKPFESAKPAKLDKPSEPAKFSESAKLSESAKPERESTFIALASDSDPEDEADDRIWEMRSRIALLKDKLMTVESIIVKYSGNSSKVMLKLKRYFRKQRANEPGRGQLKISAL